MFLHRERNEDNTGRSEITEILVEKHRNGSTGFMQLYFDTARTTFLDIDKQHTDTDPESLDAQF